MSLILISSAFSNGEAMPSKYTGDGEDVSPPLEWGGAPTATKAFALIVDDPDAPDPAKPMRTWVHWVVANIPAAVTSLPEAASQKAMPDGSVEGRNDSNDIGYSGPYPTIGRHRYFFKLYALDDLSRLTEGHTKVDLERSMEGHVLASTEMIGTYARGQARNLDKSAP